MRFFKSALVIAALVVGSNSFAKVAQGDAFPGFTLKTIDGKSFDSKSLKGKVAVVDFWAHWCEPCKISFPFLKSLAKKYNGKVVVVAVNVDDNVKDAKEFLKENPLPGAKVVSDADKALVGKVGVAVMPTSFVLEKSGKVHLLHQGFREGDQAEVEKALNEALKAK
jgi:cytochrome c biogenesis protein CcmG/thiol:disulfide interchange protein DsbE